jgi:hypothetical protein
MTGQQWRQLGVLGGLAAVLGTIIYVQSRGVSNPSTVSNVPARTGNAAAPLTAAPVVDVKLEALHDTPGEPPESERNPFRFRGRVVDPDELEASGRGQGRGGRATAPAPVPPPVVARPEPQGPPPPPPITLRFIGIVDPAASDARAAIFSDMRGNVFSGREGDIIEGRYRVLKVGADAAELAYLDGRGRQTIRLSGQ